MNLLELARHFQRQNCLRVARRLENHAQPKFLQFALSDTRRSNPAKLTQSYDLRRDKGNRVTRFRTVMRPRRRAFGVSDSVNQILLIDSSLQLCWPRALHWIHLQYPMH